MAVLYSEIQYTEKETLMDSTDLQQFESHRRLMFSIAYRMLGSAVEAEDILQDAFLRYQAVQSSEINSPKAFLGTVVTRLCLNRLESAQSQRETYIGPWLPEPILTIHDEFHVITGTFRGNVDDLHALAGFA